MGIKEELLREILNGSKGERITVTEDSFKKKAEIKRIYKQLKGASTKIPLNIGNLDIKLGKKYIELDEQLHFNRYRLITLNSKIYENSILFDVELYKRLCESHEPDCLKSGGYGGKWMNNSTEKLFAKSSPYKDLKGNGPSRWRQRAFYDFVKDNYAIEHRLNLRRISIWERTASSILIKDILDNNMKQHYPELKSFVMAKFEK